MARKLKKSATMDAGDNGWAITQRAKILNQQTFNSKHELESALRRQVRVVDQDTLLEQKKLEMKKIQEALDAKRADYAEKEKVWREREDILTRKKEQFIRRINDMQLFSEKTQRKIEKYHAKAEEERKLNAQKDTIIAQLREKIKVLEEVKTQRENHLDKIAPYSEYLHQVLLSEPSFEVVSRILARYETLKQAHEELSTTHDRQREQHKRVQLQIQHERKTRQNDIFALNADLGSKRQALESQRGAIKSKENQIVNAQHTEMKHSKLLGQISMSINNLHDRCKESRYYKIKNVNAVPDESIDKKLNVIHKRIEDLMDISQEVFVSCAELRSIYGMQNMN